jgi:hypothetical protein
MKIFTAIVVKKDNYGLFNVVGSYSNSNKAFDEAEKWLKTRPDRDKLQIVVEPNVYNE